MTKQPFNMEPIVELFGYVRPEELAKFLDTAIFNDVAYEIQTQTATNDVSERMYFLRTARDAFQRCAE